MKTNENLAGLMQEAFAEHPEGFRPRAFFDQRLDCIRVITKDCSVLEERLSERVTVLRNLYDPESGPECVGFTLKGALHLCHQWNFDSKTPVQVSVLLNAMLQSFPEQAVQVFIEYVAKRLVAEKKIELVDMSNFRFQPA